MRVHISPPVPIRNRSVVFGASPGFGAQAAKSPPFHRGQPGPVAATGLPDRLGERSPASPGSQDAPLGPQMDTPAPAGPDAVTGFPSWDGRQPPTSQPTRHGRLLPERFPMGMGEMREEVGSERIFISLHPANACRHSPTGPPPEGRGEGGSVSDDALRGSHQSIGEPYSAGWRVTLAAGRRTSLMRLISV